MIFCVTMKTPDALEDVIKRVSQDEDEQEEIENLCRRWFSYGEIVTLEIDTDEKTCIVVNN
jgi:hypothetical protein